MQISNFKLQLRLYYRILEFPVAHHTNVMQITLIVELNSLRIFQIPLCRNTTVIQYYIPHLDWLSKWKLINEIY